MIEKYDVGDVVSVENDVSKMMSLINKSVDWPPNYHKI